MGIKVLFLYPNTYGTNMIPPAIALFSAMLKKRGHKIEIFDNANMIRLRFVHRCNSVFMRVYPSVNWFFEDVFLYAIKY